MQLTVVLHLDVANLVSDIKTMTKAFLFTLLIFIIFSLNSVFAANVTLVYSGNMDGELEPCGCSEGGDKGGIKRRVKKVDELREKEPNLVLFSTGGLLVSEIPQDKLKSEYILKGLEQLEYDAIGVQWQDLAYGPSLLSDTFINFLSSNSIETAFQQETLVEKNGHTLAFYSWLDPETDPNKSMGGKKSVNANTKELLTALKNAKHKKHTTVLSTTLPLKKVKLNFSLKDIDILIIEPDYEVINKPVMEAKTLVLQPGSRGMRLGKLNLEINETGDIKKWSHKVIALPVDIGDAPRMEGWYKEYNDKVRVDYEKRVAARKKMISGKSPYAGEKTCETCHQKEHSIWFDTRHAEAFFKLMDVGKSFDPNCIGCHTVGFEKQGGYLDYMLTKDLANVQCENCHGAAREHAESAGQKPVANKGWKPEKMCAQCHVQKHSAEFKFETYWPPIKH